MKILSDTRLKGRWAYHYNKCIKCETTKIRHFAKGLCGRCYDGKRRMDGCFKEWYIKNKDKNREKSKKFRTENRDRLTKRRREIYYQTRRKILDMYGGVCQCCGEKEIKFLCIDHIGGGGKKHREQINKENIYRWLYAREKLSGFQVLCHNCNLAKGFYGRCPHENNYE